MKAFWLAWIISLRMSFGLDITDSMLLEGYQRTLEAIDLLENQWEIQEYPNFLHSVKMSSKGWEMLKVRFEKKILEGLIHGNSQFIAGFMGSSVTAGHDSLFSQSFPVVIGNFLNSTMSLLNVNFISRNLAIGNNPCMPYDLCPLTFAGSDADLVHWEQTYNCGFGDCLLILEKFIRQSLSIPSHPIIIFADSSTPNWHEKDCPADVSDKNITLSDHERQLYQLSRNLSGIKKIAIELNHDIHQRVCHSPALPLDLSSFSSVSWESCFIIMVMLQASSSGITLGMKSINVMGLMCQLGETAV
jgi:hypothetical protein